ncbi:MAG: methyltransferase [Lactobacillaceae bacterium]|jgi:16S rRNA (guanine1207-N2)-methyltransferase|nr:methyltransferase [Lactobacillaceae bacterium]
MSNDGEQYFTSSPTSPHDYQNIEYQIKGKKFQFVSDSGVFSRSRVDYGTNVLLNTYLDTDILAEKILDLGTGYGVVGTVINRLTDAQVDMVDVNQRAIDLANKNLVNNNAKGNAYLSNIYENTSDDYDVILVNPPIRAGKDVVTTMLVESIQHLKVGGQIFVVIQKKQGEPSARKNLEKTFGNVDILQRDKGYYILRSIKNG